MFTRLVIDGDKIEPNFFMMAVGRGSSAQVFDGADVSAIWTALTSNRRKESRGGHSDCSSPSC